MELFDTHAHYEDHLFDEDRYQALDRLKDSDVRFILNCCSDESVFDCVIDIAERYDYAFCSIGIHPHWSGTVSDDYLERIAALAGDSRVKAIGEMGLDYFYKDDRSIQKKVFTDQLELARQLDKPVIIHDREAHRDVFDIIATYQPQGILHRYGGSREYVERAAEMGMYFSVNSDITYPNWERKHLDGFMAIPLDRLLVETDCPYSPPYGSGKERSESTDVISVLEKVAAYHHISIEEAARITFENSLRVYRI